jgi:multiple sugar transport system substrate-binding protein
MIPEQHIVTKKWARMVQSGRMTRRAFLERTVALGIGSSAAIALLDACSGIPTASGSATSITYWNLFGGGDGVRMIQMENDFSKSHPNINLQSIVLAWGDPYYTKLAMAAAGGRPPDVAISHMTRVATYAAQNLLEPFDLNELAKYGITEDKFLAPIWQRAHHFGQLYTIPLDTHPFVMYYNVDIAKKAGLLDASGNLKPIQGANALLDALKAAKQVTGQYGVVFESSSGVTPWRLFSSLYSQLGGQVLSPDGKEVALDDTKAEQALSFMADLTVNTKVADGNSDYPGAVALFGGGKSGFHWNGEWEVTTFQNQKGFPFSMVPFPLVFDEYHTEADSHAFVLPHQIAVDPARRAASLELISFLLNDSYTWAQGGHIPAYLPVTASTQYKTLKPQSNYASVADSVTVDPNAWFSGSGSELENQAGNVFATVLTGQATPVQGIKQFRATIQKLLSVQLPFQQ